MSENDKLAREFEALIKAYAEYEKNWSDEGFPITQEEKAAYEAGFGDAWLGSHDRDKQTIERLRGALHQLACLGNGSAYGNSEGNIIAQEALALTHQEPTT